MSQVGGPKPSPLQIYSPPRAQGRVQSSAPGPAPCQGPAPLSCLLRPFPTLRPAPAPVGPRVPGPSSRPLTSPAPARPAPAPRHRPGPRGCQSSAGRAGAPRLSSQHPAAQTSGSRSMAQRCGPRRATDGRVPGGRTGGERGRALCPNLWLVPAGGLGCSRGGVASWTCSPTWSCCLGSKQRPPSRVRPLPTRKCLRWGRPPPAALCAGLRPVPGGYGLSPARLGFGPGRRSRFCRRVQLASGRRLEGAGVGPGPYVRSVLDCGLRATWACPGPRSGSGWGWCGRSAS